MGNESDAPRVAVVVVAAGSGSRLGEAVPKAFVDLGGRTILHRAISGAAAARVAEIVVVVPAGRERETRAMADEIAARGRQTISVVVGGSSRQQSVSHGLAAVLSDAEVVLVHDAARALTPTAVFHRVIEAVAKTGRGAVPVLPVVDTIKRIARDEVVGVVDRAELGAAQTPQGFPRDLLVSAYETADAEHTDDAALAAAAGCRVGTVEGHPLAFKITTPTDLERARTLVAPSPPGRLVSAPRVGVGTDVHAFGGEGELWLAGLHWPGETALSGHSDGDAVAHAVVDALLSAAGLGDIGTHFGSDRPEHAGAHAAVFLARTRALLADAGWAIGNVSVQLQAPRPRFAPRRAEAEAVLSAALGGAPVSVSATTTDGLGFTGRGEGVAAFAVATLMPTP